MQEMLAQKQQCLLTLKEYLLHWCRKKKRKKKKKEEKKEKENTDISSAS